MDGAPAGLAGVHVQAPDPNPPAPTSLTADPRFLNPLVLEYMDGRNWKLVHAFDYCTDVDALFTVNVPEGFITDFASIPKILWNILPPTGAYGKAAVVHDYLYRTPGLTTRLDADNVFREAMKALGVGAFRRNLMYLAVHLFGERAYKGGL